VDDLKLAWRNVWRNRRRTLVTVAATALALLTMIVYSGLVEGYLRGMEHTVVALEVGDLQIASTEYRERPSLYDRVEDADEVVKRLDEAGFAASARLLGSGLAAAGDTSAGVSMRGVDVDRDRRVSEVYTRVADGEWLDSDDVQGVVLGTRLARILGLGVGDELVVLSQGADGSMANDLFHVRGVLGSVADGVDRGGIYMNSAAFRALMVLPTGAHQIMVRRPDNLELSAAATRIRELVPQSDVKSWRDLMPTMASMLDSTRGALVAMFAVIYMAIGIVILNAMLMAVFERIREFGVLKALGVGPFAVFKIIVAESGIQVLLAVALGGLLSIPANAYLSTVGINLSSVGNISVAGVAFDPFWRSVVTVDTYVGPIVALITIVGLAVLYPALKAAFIRPVEAMRHQ
jgi:putative ABC transport system permease protein